MVDYQTLSIIFTGLSVSIAAFYYISTLRNTRKNQELQLETRRTQIFMQIYDQLKSEESMKSWAELVNMEVPDFDEFIQKYDSSVNPTHYAKRSHIWYSFNSIGELLRMGTIEVDLVYRLQLSPMVITLWENWEHIIRGIRARENAPELSEGFEYLYNELKKLRNEKGYPEYNYPQLRKSDVNN